MKRAVFPAKVNKFRCTTQIFGDYDNNGRTFCLWVLKITIVLVYAKKILKLLYISKYC